MKRLPNDSRRTGQKGSRWFEVTMTVIAVLVGCGLSVLAVTWIATGRIDYWTGPTERQHFVATPESGFAAYWLRILLCGGGAVALWYKLIANLVRWLRSRAHLNSAK